MYGSVLETNDAVGVIGVACPDSHPLLAFVSLFAAAISRGNAVILIPSEKYPLAALQLYRVSSSFLCLLILLRHHHHRLVVLLTLKRLT